ncbi:TIGR03557 family F420-dependent LLM class oxidoreductase [Actinospica sp.]|uniref:TIGR03557 family F420-dependent LLM class oxidoreductase n=1 Tax=Actinospica sp. TaxID=1872142 RepID=UPI002C0BAFB4|nr:TIGR03557 family F420-dependent LLM class oxidoreductase [Actinospica sp.]HWG26171.1 TIGR03557 family F420-dependent LLM class oxidoreductase [Actinospica sp.]
MARVGYFLSSEEFSPTELVEQAKMAQDAGFHALWISDHFHPWNDAQGQSGFVWGTIGALSQAVDLPITTAVTCPTVRMHPAIVAQAAATAAVQTGGKFALGVGSGEALNEHILGDRWPASAGVRLEMLEEAVELIRRLWSGELVTHHGRHYTVEGARIYTLPDQPPPIYVSGFGPRSAQLAGRVGDGYVSVLPDAELVEAFRSGGGAGKPTQGGYKVCWSRDREVAEKNAYRLWSNELIPGELAQVLPQPAHFEQASSLVSEAAVADHFVCGDDPDEHLRGLNSYFEAGYDEVFVNQIGPEQRGFFDFYAERVLPMIAAPTG